MKKDFKTRYNQVVAGALNVDRSYQRGVDRNFVRRKASEFDPDAFGVLHVSLRGDGSYWVIDGQHRVEIVLSLGEDWKRQNVPCLVYEGLSVPEEAELFGRLNSAHPVHAFDRFRADVTAEDETALAILEMVKSNGFSLSKDSLSCVTVLRRIYAGFRAINREAGPENLNRTLRVLAESWGTKSPHPHGSIVHGLGLFLERYSSDVNESRLAEKLAGMTGGWNGLLGKARGLRDIEGGTVAISVFELIRRSYNLGLRAKKLNSLRQDEKDSVEE